MLEIRPLSEDWRRQWDDFARSHPHGSPFHLTAWKQCLETAFGYRAHYYGVFRGASLEALAPLFLVDNFVIGKALLSSPFAVYGGVLARDGEARQALAAHIAELGRRLEVQYVELRNAYPEQCVGWSPVDRYVTFTQPVHEQEGEELLKNLPKKTRNMIRKAQKTPFAIRRVRETHLFERLHSRTLRRLGTPSFPPKHFEELARQFGSGIDICELHHEGRVVAASMSFLFRDQMHIYYAATDPDFNHLAPNYAMYFDHLLWAGRNGYASFDFGRSKLGSGTLEFKKHWSTEMRVLPYEILLVKRKTLPNFSPANKKFDLAIKVWRRIPLALTRLAGPYLVRLFP